MRHTKDGIPTDDMRAAIQEYEQESYRRARLLGKILIKMRLAEYDPVFQEHYVTLYHYIQPFRAAFCRHEYDKLYRPARKDLGERGYRDLLDCIPTGEVVCTKCHKFKRIYKT